MAAIFLCCLRAKIYVFKSKFRSEVRHLEFLLPVRPYRNPNGSFGFSFRRPFQRCITCYIIRCLRQKSKVGVVPLLRKLRRKIGMVIRGLRERFGMFCFQSTCILSQLTPVRGDAIRLKGLFSPCLKLGVSCGFTSFEAMFFSHRDWDRNGAILMQNSIVGHNCEWKDHSLLA